MAIDELIDRVKVKMEEYTPFAETTALAASESMGFETKPIVSYIRKTIDEACNEMLMTLPLHLIRSDKMVIIDQIKYANGSGVLGLGDTFLRVHRFKMQDWKTTLHHAEQEGSDIAQLQENPYTMGGIYKPVLVYHRSLDVFPRNKSLSYYSCPSGSAHEIESAWQVSRFDENNIQGELVEFFTLNCAKKVYDIYGMGDKASLLDGELTKLIEAYTR